MGVFTLEATGDVVHQLRKISQDDQAWIKRTFGKPLDHIFAPGAEVDFSNTLKIVYHQLVDKTRFPGKVEYNVLDDDGFPVKERRVTGVEVLAQAITSPVENMDIMSALLKTMGNSNAVEIRGVVEKKIQEKLSEYETKSQAKSAGQASST